VEVNSGEWARIWKEVIIAYFKVSRNSIANTEEKYGKLKLE
jgi:hypothetical protein